MGNQANMVLAVVALSGCVGAIGSGEGSGAEQPGVTAADPADPTDFPGGLSGEPPPVCDEAAGPATTPLRKLSTVQYRNTVRDLLEPYGGVEAFAGVGDALARVPEDSLGDAFRGLDDRVSAEHIQGYFDVALAVGDAVVDDPDRLADLAGECALGDTPDDDCVEAFLSGFARRAYRRPLAEEERRALIVLEDGSWSGPELWRARVIMTLTAPAFVNHLELDGVQVDGDEDLLRLNGYELASRLAYAFWQTMPDPELLEAAENGSLHTEDGFLAQLDRVYDDPRTRETLWTFWHEWLRLEKFTGFEASRPGFRAMAEGERVGEPGHDHYADMVQEVRDLVELYTFEEGGTLQALLMTRVSVTESPDLARLYGVAPYRGTGPYPELPEGTRAGLLQRAALLVSPLEQTNPFHRGAFTRRTLLCDELPQPDPNTLPPGSLDPPPASAVETTRERYQAKIEGNSLCEGCHNSFADIGYVLESFDALGRFRDEERVFDEQTGELLAELPLDTEAAPRIERSDDSPVDGPAELNQRIVESGKVDTCLARRYFEYMVRREPDYASDDRCVIADLEDQLRTDGAGLAGMFRRIAQHPSFFLHKVGPQ